jgi:putative membrane protein
MIGGVVASWVMTRFQELWLTIDAKRKGKAASKSMPESKTEPATVVVAEAISSKVFHHQLTPQEKQPAGQAVHYAYGSGAGALYGAAAEIMPSVTAGHGTLYGTGLWFAGDEVAVPLLRLSEPPTQTPATTHVYALASHLVYGLTLETVRSVLRPTAS